MRLIFMGTPDFAQVILAKLVAAGHDIAGVYAQPARPSGRGQAPRLSAVQAYAEKLGLAVFTPLNFKDPRDRQTFVDLQAEAAVVAAYGLLLPQAILDAPQLGCFNVHASLLPRWRGAAPIQRAIMAGDSETGISIMQMEAGLDTGPVLLQARLPITPETTAGDLHDGLAQLGAKLMVELLSDPIAYPPHPQPETGVTYAAKIDKAEARIDFSRPALEVLNHIHGLSPYPGAWFNHQGARIKILACVLCPKGGEAGRVLDDKLTIACGEQSIRPLIIQREGKTAVTADAFLRGFALVPGSRLS